MFKTARENGPHRIFHIIITPRLSGNHKGHLWWDIWNYPIEIINCSWKAGLHYETGGSRPCGDETVKWGGGLMAVIWVGDGLSKVWYRSVDYHKYKGCESNRWFELNLSWVTKRRQDEMSVRMYVLLLNSRWMKNQFREADGESSSRLYKFYSHEAGPLCCGAVRLQCGTITACSYRDIWNDVSRTAQWDSVWIEVVEGELYRMKGMRAGVRSLRGK